jgi:uncharacterized protein (UPF0276 family)
MSRIQLKTTNARVSLGVGLDMPWGTSPGFKRMAERDDVDTRLTQYLDRHACELGHFFFAFQPKNRDHLRAADYFSAYDALFEHLSEIRNFAFHHTMLNVCGDDQYDRRRLLAFTNEIVKRYRIKWINEDIGVWSLGGKPLPYPLPPLLDKGSLQQAKRVVRDIQTQLDCPFVLEFPGFTDGSSLLIGDIDAFDFFSELAEATGSWVNLDTGHVLSYLSLCSRLGRSVPDLSRLPLARCFEVHLAGSRFVNGKFQDTHDGCLVQQQFDLLVYLLHHCHELRAVTFEDPRLLQTGEFDLTSQQSWATLTNVVSTHN